MIGTSGGAQAATGLTSDKSFDVIYDEQIAHKSNETPPVKDMSGIFERYAQIQEHSKSPKEWIENYSVYALEDHKFNESVHITRLEHRIKGTEWHLI